MTPWRGWAPLVALPSAVLVLAPSHWPPWAFMCALAASIYAGCKWLTWRRTPIEGVPWWKHAGYLLAWPGFDAVAFLAGHSQEAPSATEWGFAFAKSALGLALFFGVARLVSPDHVYLAGWIGMIGLGLILHFGTFHLLSCAWRTIGVDARPLMHQPLRAVSVGEFWGRRWNTAFRDLTHRFLFRPLVPRVGARGAIICGFVFSGVVHDLVISVPAAGGYGGPTLFFTLQAAAVLLERSSFGRRIGLGHGWRGWLFAMIVLAAPVYWLFHPAFVGRVIVPFMRAVSAL